MAKLGEVCLLKAGKFVSANDISPEYNKGLYPCFGGNGIRGYVADYTHDGEFPLIGRQGALCGNVNLASGKFHATEHAVVVQPKIEMNVHWLYYALNAMNLGQYATGAAQPGLAVSKLETLSIETPNISEQNKIAQTLYKVEQLVNFRKQQLAKLDELVKARFVEMYGESEYPCNSLISLIIEGAGLSYGIVQPGDDGTGDMGVLRPVDFADGKIKTDSIKYIDRSLGDGFKKTELNGNELLITVRGTTGITALTDSRFKGMNVTRGIAVIRYDEKKIDPIYLNEYLKMEESQQYIKEHTRGATLQQINLSDLRDLKVMVPPLLLQQAFSTFVERVDQQKQTVQQSLEKLELMKKALMQEYFG